MITNRGFTIFLLALGVLSAGWLVQSNSPAADAKLPPKDKEKKESKNLVVTGDLTANDPKDTARSERYCKVYSHKMIKGETYQVDMKSRDFDSFLRVENAKGTEVATDDDGGGGKDARIVYKAAETGNFKVIATSFAPGETGRFSLTIRKRLKPTALTLKDGKGSATANLVADDGKFKGKLQKTFEVALEAGKTYQFDQRSTEFDSYLFLVGPDGKVLAENDDGGGGLNSRIVFKAEKAGRYRLVASSFAGGDLGQFTISVAEK